jgi:hypothetical protein
MSIETDRKIETGNHSSLENGRSLVEEEGVTHTIWSCLGFASLCLREINPL